MNGSILDNGFVLSGKFPEVMKRLDNIYKIIGNVPIKVLWHAFRTAERFDFTVEALQYALQLQIKADAEGWDRFRLYSSTLEAKNEIHKR